MEQLHRTTQLSSEVTPDDPWLWSVDDVVRELCHNSAVLLENRPRATLPAPETLEPLLRSQNVDGPTILEDLDRSSLKNFLGITSLGEVSAFLHIVGVLRSRSKAHHESHASGHVRAFSPSNGVEEFHTPTLSPGTAPSGLEEVPQEALNTSESPRQPRSNEVFVEDATGRKRRKLLITSANLGEKPTTSTIFSGQPRAKHTAFLHPHDRSLANDGNDVEENADTEMDDAQGVSGEESDGSNVTSDTSNEWAFLLDHWPEQPDDEALPLYGESVIHSDYSDGSFAAELEEENDHRSARKHISRSEINDIIDEEVQAYVTSWNARKLPVRQAASWSIWLKGSDAEAREVLREGAAADIQRLKNRQDAIATNIHEQDWLHISELRRQCLSLEQTVHEIQELKYKISVWGLDQPPARPTVPPRPSRSRSRKKYQAPENDDESIILTSEDEEGYEDIEDGNLVGEFSSKGQGGPSMAMHAPQGGTGSGPPDDDDSDVAPSSDAEIDIESYGPEMPKLDEASLLRWIREVDSFRSQGKPSLTESSSTIEAWNLRMLDHIRDPQRIIIKLVDSMSVQQRESLEGFVRDLKDAQSVLDIIKEGIVAFFNKEDRVLGLDLSDSDCTLRLTRLFLCYYHKSSIPYRLGASCLYRIARSETSALKRLSQSAHNESTVAGQWNRWQWREAVCFLHDILAQGQNHDLAPQPNKPQIQDIIVLSDDDSVVDSERPRPSADSEDSVLMPPPKSGEFSDQKTGTVAKPKKRVNAVRRDQTAVKRRKREVDNFYELQRRSERMQHQRAQGQVQKSDAFVNPGKADHEPEIYINPQIASKIKPHQIEGVQFMWLRIITVKDEEESGCLLAHSMGLGKTMQAITLITTIAEAGSSTDPAIQDQIPRALRCLKCIILCPASLVPTWRKELHLWVPASARRLLGELVVYRGENPREWYHAVRSWDNVGGIIVMGYDRFKKCMAPAEMSDLEETAHQQMKQWLINGTNIVIADEAHKYKDENTDVHRVMSQFKTKTRIAMTGSPLSNSLSEYYTMINWVSPGYLGSAVEFRAHYEEPIKAGNWDQSTEVEKRIAQRTLKSLEHECAPKVHRRDQSILSSELKAKVEFFLTVPLTAAQTKLYEIYAAFARADNRRNLSYSNHLSWIKTLRHINAHPAIFDASGTMRRARETVRSLESTATGVNAVARENLHLVGLVDRVGQTLRDTAGPLSPTHSYRVQLLMQILHQSVAIGDQILVFTHSIAALNFIEKLVRADGSFRVLRIDGATHVLQREALIADFNKGAQNVGLLSTEAIAHGFNIIGANRAVIFDFDFNPQWEEQAIARIYRIGQKKKAYIYRFVASGTYEGKLLNDVIFKTQLAGKVIKGKNTENVAQRKMEYLQNAVDPVQENLDNFIGIDPVLDGILATYAAGGKHAIRKITTSDALEMEKVEQWTAKDQEAMQLEVAQRQTERRKKIKSHSQRAPSAGTLPDGDRPLSTVDNIPPESVVFGEAAPANASSHRFAAIPSIIEVQAQVAKECPKLSSDARSEIAAERHRRLVAKANSDATSAFRSLGLDKGRNLAEEVPPTMNAKPKGAQSAINPLVSTQVGSNFHALPVRDNRTGSEDLPARSSGNELRQQNSRLLSAPPSGSFRADELTTAVAPRRSLPPPSSNEDLGLSKPTVATLPPINTPSRAKGTSDLRIPARAVIPQHTEESSATAIQMQPSLPSAAQDRINGQPSKEENTDNASLGKGARPSLVLKPIEPNKANKKSGGPFSSPKDDDILRNAPRGPRSMMSSPRRRSQARPQGDHWSPPPPSSSPPAGAERHAMNRPRYTPNKPHEDLRAANNKSWRDQSRYSK